MIAALVALAAAPLLAVTFDDLPAHGPLPPGETRMAVMRWIAATLTRERVPARGFVNGGLIAGAPEAMTPWLKAGLPIGNHGWSHLNLDTAGADAFVADAVRNETAMMALASGGGWHWFRYPFLAEGRDPAVRDAVRRALVARGYRIAPVTMSFGDFLWPAAYARCAGRAAGTVALERAYLDAAAVAADAARAAARGRYGRDVPQVLLLHVGAVQARTLPALIALYRARGYRFVTLERALADPAYRDGGAPILPVTPPPALLDTACR